MFPAWSRWYAQVPILGLTATVVLVAAVGILTQTWSATASPITPWLDGLFGASILATMLWWQFAVPLLASGDPQVRWPHPPQKMLRNTLWGIWGLVAMWGYVATIPLVSAGFTFFLTGTFNVDRKAWPIMAIGIALVAATIPAACITTRAVRRRMHRNARSRQVCFACGYDLRANAAATACPECGHPSEHTALQPAAPPAGTPSRQA